MRSELFVQTHQESQTTERFSVHQRKMLRVVLGDPVLAAKGSMVAYQGQVTFEHKSAGSIGKMMRRLVTSEDTPLLDCSQAPTYVDVNSAVCWSAELVPKVVSSMNMRSMMRGGTGEAFQYVFHGPGFLVVQPSEGPGVPPHNHGSGGGLGSILGE